MISPSFSGQKRILQQGYLQQFKDESCFKVFAIVKDSELLLYRDDPANNPRTTLFSSVNLAKAQVLEEGDYRRPKSFGLVIDKQYFEFSCPTNSVKASWLKSLSQSRTSPTLEGLRKLQSNMELFRSPVPINRAQSQQQIPTSTGNNYSTASSYPDPYMERSYARQQQSQQHEPSYFGDAMQQLKSLSSSGAEQASPAQTQNSLLLKPVMKKAATLCKYFCFKCSFCYSLTTLFGSCSSSSNCCRRCFSNYARKGVQRYTSLGTW